MIRVAFTLANTIAKYLSTHIGTSDSLPQPSSRAGNSNTSKPSSLDPRNHLCNVLRNNKPSMLSCKTSPAPSRRKRSKS